MTLPLVPGLNDLQSHFLRYLFEEGPLNTGLIHTHLAPAESRRQVGRTLEQLRTRGLVRSEPLGATAHSEFCWIITYAGTRALGHRVVHAEARYRVPADYRLTAKALVLTLRATLDMMSWSYLRPQVYNPGHPKPDDTPQRQALYQAVAAHFARTAADTGAPRLHPSQVPAGLNDWVAWPATAPERAVVLIPHPVGGTPHFWRYRARTSTRRPRVQERGRAQVYADVGQILPVYGVFATPELLHDYQPILQGTAIRPVIPDTLLLLICPQPDCRAACTFASEARQIICPTCGWQHSLSAGEYDDLLDALDGISDLPIAAYLQILAAQDSPAPPPPCGGAFPQGTRAGDLLPVFALLLAGARLVEVRP